MANKLNTAIYALTLAGLCAGVIVATSAPSKAQGAWSQGLRSDYNFESSAFMRHTAYRSIATLDSADSPDGAYNPQNIAWDQSHEGKWYIEQQRFGGDLVDGGVATGNEPAIARGLRIIQWGLNQENPDGSFDCPDRYHSTSFFVEASAHALLMVEESPFAGQFRGEIAPMIGRIHKSGEWMADPGNVEGAKFTEAPYTHRRYMDAAAIGEAGVLGNDPSLVEASVPFIEDGLSMQDPSGFNPEKGGYDSSYNALGTFYALRYYIICASGELKIRMYKMLQGAIGWEATRIQPDGTVSTEGNTRVGANGESNRGGTGGKKKVAVGQVFRSFYYWSRISGDTSYAKLGVRVARGNRMADAEVPNFY